MIHSDYGMCAV